MDETLLSAGEVDWTMISILALTATGGAIGGLTALLVRLTLKDTKRLKVAKFHMDDQMLSGGNFFLVLVIQILIGVCGAAAVVFVFSSTTWFPDSATPITKVWLLTLSVVAGFGARRFLPMVTKRLENQMKELEAKVVEDIAVQKESLEASEISAAERQALALLDAGAKPQKSELKAALNQLMVILHRYPLERKATIVAGRLCVRDNERYEDALAILTSFINHKKESGQLDIDLADVLFNRACYYCLLSKAQGGDDEFDKSGLVDLKESIKYSEENRVDAEEDEDFEFWTDKEEFRSILRISNDA